MNRIVRENYQFEAANGFGGACRVEVAHITDTNHIVTITDLGEGPSVTNNIDIIAASVVATFGINPQHVTFVEHYHYPQSSYRGPGRNITYDTVTFKWTEQYISRKKKALVPTKTKWTYLSEKNYRKLFK